MTNPYIDKIIKNPENKSKKKGYTLRDWIIMISTILCASFIILIVNFPEIIWYVERPRGCSWCGETETDAQNTLAALASYFSEPEHTKVPTVQDLMNEENLTLNKNSTVIIDGSKDEIRVTVIEKKNRCVRGNKYEVYMGGTAGEWYRE